MPLRSDTDAYQDDAFQNPPDGPAFEREIVFDDAFQDSGFDSGEAFQYDTAAAANEQIQALGDIASAEGFAITLGIRNATVVGGIGSGEAFGTARLVANITLLGDIGSGEAVGQPTGRENITELGGISTGEAFGTAYFIRNATELGGITSAEAFGTTTGIRHVTDLGAIASEEAFGIDLGRAQAVDLGELDSDEAFGEPTLSEHAGPTVQPGPAHRSGTPARRWQRPRPRSTSTAVPRKRARLGAIDSAEAFGAPHLIALPAPVDEDEELLLLVAAIAA